jgi:hypothetical protein
MCLLFLKHAPKGFDPIHIAFPILMKVEKKVLPPVGMFGRSKGIVVPMSCR